MLLKIADGLFEIAYRLTWSVSAFLALLVCVTPDEARRTPASPSSASSGAPISIAAAPHATPDAARLHCPVEAD